MKKLVAGAFLLASLASFAAFERIATVQIANPEDLTKSASAFGELINQQMMGSMAAGMTSGLPWIKLFGPMRSNAASSVLLGVYLDSEQLLDQIGSGSKCSNIDKCLQYFCMLSPVADKAKFAASKPGAQEKDGALFVEDGLFDDDVYVVYSDDGKWAVASPNVEIAKKAIADVKLAQKPMSGRALAMTINKSGMKAFATLLDKARDKDAEVAEAIDDGVMAMIRSIVGATGSVKVSDKGLDFTFGVVPVPDSELARLGKKPLGPKPLAFAGKDAVSAVAAAAGSSAKDPSKIIEKVLAVMKDNGLDTTSFLSVKSDGKLFDCAIDPRKLADWAEAMSKDDSKSPDVLKIIEAIQALPELKGARTFDVNSPEQDAVVRLVGYAGKAPLQRRFEATLPEAAGKPVFNAQFFSLYSILKAVIPTALEKAPEEQREMFKPILAQLPEEGLGGIASMSWIEGGAIRAFVRIGADEFKGLSGAYNAFMGVMMMQAMQGVGAAAGDDDDDDDDDGDED